MTRSRPIENRYAIGRGVTNGTSAIVSPRGEVIVHKDHFKEGAALLAALVLLAAAPADAAGVASTKLHLVLPDCTAPTQPGQWPANVPLTVIAIRQTCTLAPGDPQSCTCEYLPPEALALEQRAADGTWKPVPGSFKLSHRQCQGLSRLLYDRALLPGTYQVRAGTTLFGPLTLQTMDLGDTARVPAVLPKFEAPCTEPPAPPPTGGSQQPAAAAPGAVPPRGGCASCAVGRSDSPWGAFLTVVVAALVRGARRRVRRR